MLAAFSVFVAASSAMAAAAPIARMSPIVAPSRAEDARGCCAAEGSSTVAIKIPHTWSEPLASCVTPSKPGTSCGTALPTSAPQQLTPPATNTAHVVLPALSMESAGGSDTTRTGLARSTVVPSPSPPLELLPQQLTPPSARSAHVRESPATTCDTPVNAAIVNGESRGSVNPSPMRERRTWRKGPHSGYRNTRHRYRSRTHTPCRGRTQSRGCPPRAARGRARRPPRPHRAPRHRMRFRPGQHALRSPRARSDTARRRSRASCPRRRTAPAR